MKDQVIDLSLTEIADLYEFWTAGLDNFSKVGSKKANIIYDRQRIQETLSVPTNGWLLGIDFPTWFNEIKEDTQKIMILGIDPLRNELAFKSESAHRLNDVLLGTPYGVHQPHMRTHKTKQYWHFVDALAQDSFVYLTDIYKVFFYANPAKTERSYQYFRKNQINSHKALLLEEIRLIKPTLIITLGAESYRQLLNIPAPKLSTKVDNNITLFLDRIPVLPLMHLSSATRSKNKDELLSNNQIKVYDHNYGAAFAAIAKRYLTPRKAA